MAEQTVNCPQCGNPDATEIADEVDIGVGVQRHVFGFECPVCGQVAIPDEAAPYKIPVFKPL